MPAFDAKAAAALINAELKQQEKVAAAAAPAGAVAAMGAGVDFCAIWPKVKPILETIAGIAAFIPGIGSTAGAVLKGLLQIGDKIAAETCGK
jgi:hypothetical protein